MNEQGNYIDGCCWILTHTRTGITNAAQSIREMRGRMDGFAPLGSYSKAKQTHEADWSQSRQTWKPLEIRIFRLCCMHCSICIDCFNASPHAQSVDVRTSPSVTASTAMTLTKKAVMTGRKARQSQRCSILRAVELTGQRHSIVLLRTLASQTRRWLAMQALQPKDLLHLLLAPFQDPA